MRFLVLLALSGCLVVPTTHESTVPLGRYATPTIAGPVGKVSLEATQSYATIHVTAQRARRCYREVKQRYDHRSEVVASAVGGSVADVGDGGLVAIGTVAVLVAPVTLLMAGATAVAVATSKTEHAYYEETVRTVAMDCPVPGAGVGIDVALPSGAVIHATTNAAGLAHVTIPADEAASGVAVVRAEDAAVRVAYP